MFNGTDYGRSFWERVKAHCHAGSAVPDRALVVEAWL